MALSAAEADTRYEEAKKAWAESSVLQQWYWILREIQKHAEAGTGDTDQHFILYDSDVVRWVEDQRIEEGGERPAEFEDYVDLFVEFINGLIGDQLQELGLETRKVNVTNGYDSATRIYLLKPDQQVRIR